MKGAFKILQPTEAHQMWEGKEILDFDGNIRGKITHVKVEREGIFCRVKIDEE